MYTLSEARASHWMLLVLADRIDVVESRFGAMGEGRPGNPISETGVLAELEKHSIRSGRHRVDIKHQWMDPLITIAPYAIGGYLVYRAGRAIAAAVGRDDDDTSWRMAARRRRAEVAGDDGPVPRTRMDGDTYQPGYR
jgi:hypothetical protein